MKKINESYKLIVFAALALALVLYIGNIWSGLQSLTSVFHLLYWAEYWPLSLMFR